MIPLGILAASRYAPHAPIAGWHMASSNTYLSAGVEGGVVDLGPESPNRHVAIILRIRRQAPTGTAGAFNTVSIGGSPVAFTEVISGTAGRMVVGVAHVPKDGPVTYTNEPHTGGTTQENIAIAAYPGEIAMSQYAGGSLWSGPLSFSLNVGDGDVGLLVGALGGLVVPSNLEYFGGTSQESYAGWEHTTAPTWGLTLPRVSNSVGTWCAATFAPTGG